MNHDSESQKNERRRTIQHDPQLNGIERENGCFLCAEANVPRKTPPAICGLFPPLHMFDAVDPGLQL
jgi:hypothetical protein